MDAELINTGCSTAVLLCCWLLKWLVVSPGHLNGLDLNPASLLLFCLPYMDTARSHLFIYQCKHRTNLRNFHSCHYFQKENNCCKLLYETFVFFFQSKPVAVPCITNKGNNIRIAITFLYAGSKKKIIKKKQFEKVGALERHQSWVPKLGYSLSQHCLQAISSHFLQFGVHLVKCQFPHFCTCRKCLPPIFKTFQILTIGEIS